MRNLWKNYNLSVVLLSLFVLFLTMQGIAQWKVLENEDEPFTKREFFWQFMSLTMENWQSEFLQLGAMVIFTAILVHKNSPQSKDGNEQIKKDIEEVRMLLRSKKE